jgi:hypothetical protein
MVHYQRAPSENFRTALADPSKFARRGADGGFVLDGECPTCHHRTQVFVPSGPVVVPTAGTLAAARLAIAPSFFRRVRGYAEPATVRTYPAVCRCGCGQDHTGQDKNDNGCGAWARLRVTLRVRHSERTS